MTQAEITDLLTNPTLDKAIATYEAFRARMGWPYPVDATREVTAMACIHKARLAWPGSTKAMVRESKAWLVAHGMRPSLDGAHHGTIQ